MSFTNIQYTIGISIFHIQGTRMPKFNDFMKISDFFYKSLGLFPYNDPRRKVTTKTRILMSTLFWANFINLNLAVLAEIVYLMKAMKEFSSFLQATALAPCIGFCFLSEFKLFWSWSMSKDVVTLIDGLKALYPKDRRNQRLFKVDFHLKKALRLGFFYSLVLTLTIWAFNLIPLAWSLVEFYTSPDQNVEFKWRLAYLTWYPFEINTVPVYAVVYITQIIAGCTAAGGFFACDIFMFNLIILLCMNFNYIEENISRRSKDFKRLVRHHQLVLE